MKKILFLITILLFLCGCQKVAHPFLGQVVNLMENCDRKKASSPEFKEEIKTALKEIEGNEIKIIGNPYDVRVSKGKIFKTDYLGHYPVVEVELIPDEGYDFDFSGFGPGTASKRMRGVLRDKDGNEIMAPYAWNIRKDYRVIISIEVHTENAKRLQKLDYIELMSSRY